MIIRKANVIALLWLLAIAGLAACGSQKTEEASKTPEATPPAASPEPSYEGVDITEGGSISGVVKFTGAKPALQPRPVTKSPEVCGHGTKPPVELVLGSGGTLRNAVITIEGIRKGKRVSASTHVLDQVKCEYVPHVQSVTAGSTLDIRNSDDLLHNVHGKLDGRMTLFNLAMPLKGQNIPKQLARPGVVTLQCDAGHTWMTGYIVVVDHPYHATTEKDGSFALTEIPGGTYKVKAWHEKLGILEQDVSVSPGAEARISFEYKAR